MEKTANVMTYGGSTAAFVCSLDTNTVVAVLSVLIALAGLALTFYYQRRQDQREQAEHEQHMTQIYKGPT